MAKVTTEFSGASSKIESLKTNEPLGLFMAQTALTGMRPYVPFDTGTLDGSAYAEPWAVEYPASYAKYVYYGKGMNFKREHHAKATAQWDRAYSAEHAQELASAGTQYLKGQS